MAAAVATLLVAALVGLPSSASSATSATAVVPLARTSYDATAPSGAGAGPAGKTAPRHTETRRHGNDQLSPRLRRVLTKVNRARSRGRTCGDTYYPRVAPLRVDVRLNRAATAYARAMARRDFFAHTSPNGTGAGDRIDAVGYRWRTYGENIAGGHDTAAAVVRGWLDSPGHCANLMGRYAEVGLGFAADPDSEYERYWVQELATR